jgi:Tfp pilus assembly protein FimT
VNEQEEIVELLKRLGATPGQADTMASQLRKRADQLAAEHQVSRAEAMRYLLDAVMKGRSGETPGPFRG